MRLSPFCLCVSASLVLSLGFIPAQPSMAKKTDPVKGAETMSDINLETIFLWDGPAPRAKGNEREDRPRLYVVRPDAKKANGAGIVVCPGGGYQGRAMDYEGLQIARRFANAGLTAFVLCYRVGDSGYGPDEALLDAQRAMRTIRHRAAEFAVDPDRIAMVGFSAGGHLIINLSLHADKGEASNQDAVERQRCDPDAALLIYPAVPGLDDDEKIEASKILVPEPPPPTFIVHTTQDRALPASGPLLYGQALVEKGAEVELHLFGQWGPHGIGMATGQPGMRDWPALAITWLRRLGLLTGAERFAVTGTVKVNGEPMHTGWITLTPTESESDPIACGWVGGWLGTPGVFNIAAAEGPVAGPHRVDIRYTVRQSGPEPSLEDEVVYPNVKTVEIKPGKNKIDIKLP